MSKPPKAARVGPAPKALAAASAAPPLAAEALVPLPWQRPLWEQLGAGLEGGRGHHACLLVAPEGLGPSHLAACHAARLLCFAPRPEPDLDAGPGPGLDPGPGGACGTCTSCRLWRAESHPDFLRAAPEEAGGTLRIDQVRELLDFAILSSHLGRGRVILLDPADAMNRAAANCLLKLLEEPPSGVVLILVAHRLAGLPATILSRCQRYTLARAAPALALPWLAGRLPAGAVPALALDLAGGAPLTALRQAESGWAEEADRVLADLLALLAGRADPVAVAARWGKLGVEAVVGVLLRLVEDLLRWRAGAPPPAWQARLPPGQADLQRAVNALDFKQMFHIRGQLLDLRRQIGLRIALRGQEQLEGLTLGIAWAVAGAVAAKPL